MTTANDTQASAAARDTRVSAGAHRPSLRRWRILLGAAVLGKVALLAVWYGDAVPPLVDVVSGVRAAFAAESARSTAPSNPTAAPNHAPAAVDVASAGRPGDERAAKPADARALLDAISRRQAELDAREAELAAREERLKMFEQDVTAKVASLEEIEKRLQARAKTASAAVDAAAESLAKVYGAMKPADAAPILERLDEPTVLGIFGRMKEKQIGEILPLMSKEKAIALTQALASKMPR